MGKFQGIILHWTAGNYNPCEEDKKHYHYLINAEGSVLNGVYTPEDNLDCSDDKYAAHCGGGNTGRIGLAVCCMKDSNTPPVRLQVEAMCNLAAQLCINYGLKPSDCITHAEFGQTHPKTASYGKIDINQLPYADVSGIKPCGDYLRNKINWYYKRWKETQ